MLAFSCPSCDAELELSDSRAGATVKCPECGHRFTAPSRGKRGPAPREREPERRSRESPAGKGRRKRARSEDEESRDDRSKAGMGIILACIGGAVVLGLAVIIGVIIILRPVKDDNRVENPKVVAQPQQVVSLPRPEPSKPPDTKPPEEKKTEAASSTGLETAGGDDSGQLIYKHLLKSAGWVLVKVPQGVSGGTGTLIDRKNRLVLTNNHVVADGIEILVFFPTYRQGKLLAERDLYLQQTRPQDLNRGRVLAKDPKRDLALIQIERVPDGIEALAIAKNSTGPGLSVHSIGNPGTSSALWIYTSGTVRQVYHKNWQTNAGTHEAQVVETQSPTNPGDSGGPLVNTRGEMVGVTQGGLVGAQLVSLFVDVSEATDFIEKTCQANGLTWARENRMVVAGNAAGVPGLIRNLESADSKVRGNAASALGGVGPEAKMAVAPLLKLLGTETDPLSRRLALEALNKIGPPEKSELNMLITSLQDPNADVRSFAAGALGALGRDARPAVPALLKAAKDKEGGVRQNALRSLGKFGLEGKDAILEVIAVGLKDTDHEVRLAAGDALAGLNVLTAADLPMLQEVLKHQDPEVRAAAARALGQVGRPAKPAIPALIEAFKGSDKGVRKAVVEALTNIGGTAKELVPIFADVLSDSDKGLSKSATLALARFGPEAKDAVPALAQLLADSDKDLRKNVAVALTKIGPEAKGAVSALSDALKEDDREFRLEVLSALGAIGPEAKAAVPTLIQVFEGKEKTVHRKCAQTLGKIGKDAVKPLITALNHENNLIRIGAAMALGEIGPAAKSARQQLTLHARDDIDYQVREVAGSALIKVMAKP